MKVGIPVWGGKVSPVFDTASTLQIIEIEDEEEISRFEIDMDEQDLTRRCLRIQVLGVDMLICGAISRHLHDMLAASGIEVIPWISGSSNDVLEAYMKGTLNNTAFLMPGCNRRNGEMAKGKESQKRCKKKRALKRTNS